MSFKFKGGLRRGTLRKSQDLDAHPHSRPKEGVLCQSTGSVHWGAESQLGQSRAGLTCTVTPPARAAQDPRRHSAASRKESMVAVPETGWLVLDTKGKQWDF